MPHIWQLPKLCCNKLQLFHKKAKNINILCHKIKRGFPESGRKEFFKSNFNKMLGST